METLSTKERMLNYLLIGAMVALCTLMLSLIVVFASVKAPWLAITLLAILGLYICAGAVLVMVRLRAGAKQTPATLELVAKQIETIATECKIDENGVIVFKRDDIDYISKYEDDFLVISAGFVCDNDIETLLDIAQQRMHRLMMLKIRVSPADEEQGEERCVVEFSVAALYRNMEELSQFLPSYIDFIGSQLCEFAKQINEIDTTPDRRKDIYTPVYRWLPNHLFKAITNGRMSPEALTDEEFLRTSIQHSLENDKSIDEWESFKINRVDNYGDLKLIVYQFPEPKMMAEAKYGAVMLDTRTLAIEYYTLEYSAENMWVYGSTNDKGHTNYGTVNSPDLERFIEWVISSEKRAVASSN